MTSAEALRRADQKLLPENKLQSTVEHGAHKEAENRINPEAVNWKRIGGHRTMSFGAVAVTVIR